MGPSRPTPLRKKLKDEAKRAKKEGAAGRRKAKSDDQTVEGWDLAVGIEIHAQLNTARKLFSAAPASAGDAPNSHVAPFDVSIPGSQPRFQPETLVPALRAALALNCAVEPVSRFDRKHYFWWDQPAGYQITQYYAPFARDGHVRLLARDGIAREDGEGVTVRIKQVQMEQDTGKTTAQPGGAQWVDFNRVGMPLVEIISEPDLRHPRTAAIFVKKVQALLLSVDACVSGMELGGLRADVNVSVRRSGSPLLGTRTEIKNLSTVKAVEDAIIAERDRQIAEIEAGRPVRGETRGWTLGSRETRRLRGKEGEVDYRYMPDPDIAPVVIGADLVAALRASVAHPPDAEADDLVASYGLSAKDALSLMALEAGGRVEFFYNVVDRLRELLPATAETRSYAPLAANWILHEMGKLTAEKSAAPDGEDGGELRISADGACERVPVPDLADLLHLLHEGKITGKVAKQLLISLYDGELAGGVAAAVESHDLWFRELEAAEYEALAEEVLAGQEGVLEEFRRRERFPTGKLMFLVGRMMREGPAERIRPESAERVLREKIRERCGV